MMGNKLQTAEVIISGKFQLVWKDWLRAMVVASVSGSVFSILTAVSAGKINSINWPATGMMILSTFASCLLNKLFTKTAYLPPVVKAPLPAAIILVLVMIGVSASAQSPLRMYPKVNKNNFERLAIAGQPDSIVNAYRFGAQIAAYGYTFSKTAAASSQAMAGVEFGYKHMQWDYTNAKWNILWSVNWVWFALNSNSPPTSIQDVQTMAALFGFDNDLIQIGPMWNPHPAPGSKPFGVAVSIGITLTN